MTATLILRSTNRKSGKVLPLVLVGLMALGLGFGVGFSLKRGLSGAGGEHDHAAPTASSDQPFGRPMQTLYTCGMHPEVIREEPGLCPKCDMKLTPMDKDRTRMILEARGEAPSEPAEAPRGDREILYWRAPMDPAYIRNEPGKSPMGMDLVPVYADELAGGPSIRIDPVTEQNMGLRYDVVRRGPLKKTVRTIGQVEYDENSLATVTTKTDGWIEQVYIQETGTQVHKGDALFEIYSPELFSAQKELLVALRDVRSAEARAAELARTRLRTARERLRLFDISEAQIERLEQHGEIDKTLTVEARNTGIVTHRNATEGDYLKAGQPAYQIADLSTVWVIAKVYESDLPYVQLGQEARMRLDYLPGKTYRGRVTYIYPYLEEGTREVPVRMEFHNPGYELKPGMYATIRLQSRVDENATLVPSMAVIDTGERQVAFVQRAPGKFEPRRVKTGLRTNDDELQVLSGLAPGTTVVVSGQFLLDSESRLREATLKMLQPGLQNTSNVLAEDMETTGSRKVAQEDAASASKYVCPMPSHAGVLYDQSGDCPICGMRMVPVDPETIQQARSIHHWTCPMPEHDHIRAKEAGKCPECGMTLIPVSRKDMERLRKAEQQQQLPKNLYTCPMPSHAHVVSIKAGRCPECDMKLVPAEAVPHGEQAEQAWRESQPTTTTQPAAEEMPTLYTCPMASHAHVVRDQPGRCPDCNMELVPATEVDHGKEIKARWHTDQATTAPQASN